MIVAATLLSAGCGGPPQFGSDEACLKAADALWTAVTAKRIELVDQAESEIQRLHDASRLPDDAFASLSEIVATARAGRWSDARARSRRSFAVSNRAAPSRRTARDQTANKRARSNHRDHRDVFPATAASTAISSWAFTGLVT